jgi:DNA-binding Lrp family transcriptional regulator
MTDKDSKTYKEEFKVSGEDLLKRVKELIAEGNVRRITVKGKDGKTIVEMPLTVGVVGAVLAAPLAAVGAIAALVTECTITVEREKKD